MIFVDKLPIGKNVVTTIWIFAVKKDTNNNIIRRKTRLVSRGFNQ